MSAIMLKLPPPIWALAYVVIAYGLSRLAGEDPIPYLPSIPFAVVLIVAGAALSVSAAALFRREGTELNPASPTNQKLVMSGPSDLRAIQCIWVWCCSRSGLRSGSGWDVLLGRLTRNAMYLGLVLFTLGIRCRSEHGRCSWRPLPRSPQRTGLTSHSRKPRCAGNLARTSRPTHAARDAGFSHASPGMGQ